MSIKEPSSGSSSAPWSSEVEQEEALVDPEEQWSRDRIMNV